jgi:tetratricopeptide (TPR) repeat protein
MTDSDWYRQECWSQEAASNFEMRLTRARGQRGEYLRIQALTLADTRRADNARPAIELAKRHLDLQPDGISAAQMHAVVARAHTTLNDRDAALEAYRHAVRLEHSRPNVRGCHYLEFAWFVASNGFSNVYDEVLSAIASNKAEQDLIFPVNQYHYFASLALIAGDTGDKATAQSMAENALKAASEGTGPFWRFPTLGIFKSKKDIFRQRLEQLAG